MTKITAMMLIILLALGGCSTPAGNSEPLNTESEQSEISVKPLPLSRSVMGDNSQPEAADNQKANSLIVYFSRTGENYGVGYIEKGNTSIVADIIAEQTGGDLFEIRTVSAYPDSYDEATEAAKQEQEERARPELVNNIDGISGYDIIFIGYPIWWGDMPMPVYTFLESHDFSKKTIVPFCTHAGSGLSSTEDRISDLFPNAVILDGLAVSGSTAQNNQEETEGLVTRWLQKNGIIE